MSDQVIRIAGHTLQDFMREVWMRVGLAEADAAIEAEVLVWANLRGIDSHGVQRVAAYLDRVDGGGMNPTPNVRVERETAATLLIEADLGFGPVVTVGAMERVMEKAKAQAIGWAEIRNITHQGAMGYYAEMAARRGMAGIAIVSNPPNMAPPGARRAGTHNSPIAIGVPGGEHGPVVLDMATSVAARGKISVAIDKGESIPLDWALDRDGNPTADPSLAACLQPAGAYKGYGLALMFECLTSLVVGNPLLSPHLLGEDEPVRGTQNSLVAALDIGQFVDLDRYRDEIDRLARGLKSLPRREAGTETLLPGEPEVRVLAERTANGIPLPPGTVAKLRDAARRCDVALPAVLEG